MNIIRWKSLDDDFTAFPSAIGTFGSDLSIDLYEDAERLVAKMNLPGIAPAELDIAIEGDILTVSGMREEEEEANEKDYYSKEIRRGSFARSVRLPKPVDAAAATADYADGILAILMPIVSGDGREYVKVPLRRRARAS